MGAGEDAELVEHLSHEIFSPERRHIIKVSTYLLLCSLNWLHQNQMEQESFLYERRELNRESIFFPNDKFELLMRWKRQGNCSSPVVLHCPADIFVFFPQ